MREWLMAEGGGGGRGVIMDSLCLEVGEFDRCCTVLLQFIFSEPFYR